jgi:hypothetical protein
MNNRKWLAYALGAALVALVYEPIGASAGLLGDEVGLIDYFPDLSTVYVDDGTATVGPGVEFPGAGQKINFDTSGFEDVDVTDTQIILTELTDVFYSPDPFNGYILTILSGAPITGVSVDAASTESVAALSFTPTSVSINMEGVVIPFTGAEAIIDVTTATAAVTAAVPESSTWAMMLLGFAGLAFAGWRARGGFRLAA